MQLFVENAMMTLYSNRRGDSPYSRKAQVILEEKGLPYEKVNINPEHLPGDFGLLNPNLRVSVLVDGDQHIFESDNIVDYLLRTYPGCKVTEGHPPLAESMVRPEHYIDDAKILVTIETIIDSAVHDLLLSASGVDPADIKPWGWVWKRDPQRIWSCLNWLDDQATPEGFSPGTFTIMDLKLMCALDFLSAVGKEDWRNRRNLAGIHERFKLRPSIEATQPG